MRLVSPEQMETVVELYAHSLMEMPLADLRTVARIIIKSAGFETDYSLPHPTLEALEEIRADVAMRWREAKAKQRSRYD